MRARPVARGIADTITISAAELVHEVEAAAVQVKS